MSANLHFRTPRLQVIDNRGLPVRVVDYLRTAAGQTSESLITRQVYDFNARLTAQWDPRLFGASPKANLNTVHGLAGSPLKIDSVDAGWRVTLPGLADEVLQRWDQRGNHWRYHYDALLRPIEIVENEQTRHEQFTYGDNDANAGDNLRGQLLTLQDSSGISNWPNFSLLGQPLVQIRVFDDGISHRSAQTYSPLNQTLTQTDAGGHRQNLHFDLAGQLRQVTLMCHGASQLQPVWLDMQYNAAGQLIEQHAANDMRSRCHYDPRDGRLNRSQASIPGQAAQQHLVYGYDRIGNVLHIQDLTFQPVYFANQLIDGERHFEYDSLYRLTRASGHDASPTSDLPGRPLPSDPQNLRNYTQHFVYDQGNNLTRLVHAREVGGYTRQMLVDPASNRALHWKEADPLPDFAAFFDAHGNQRKLQHGAALFWNAHDQLRQVTLLEHDNGLADDCEVYVYSQGERVGKRHQTHTASATHYLQVRYLPGLEIRTRDNGEELHVITLPGSVRCLHWREKPPAHVENNQLRYSLDDHLGSSLIEVDQLGRLISRETYYPFGGTALWLPSSSTAVDYKTLRYSGKEMDVSGLYYYGMRYYAPWLQRWISADPAGDVDGLNFYAFVGNDPLGNIDLGGTETLRLKGLDAIIASSLRGDERRRQRNAPGLARQSLSKAIDRHLNILAISLRRGIDAQQQILNHRSSTDFAVSSLRRGGVHLTGQIVSYGAGIAVGIGAQALGAVAPGAGNVVGVAMGFAAKKTVSALWDYAAERTGASASIKFKASRISMEKIILKAEYKTMSPINYIQQKYSKMLPDTQKGALKGIKEGASTAVGLAAKSFAPDMASEVSATASGLLGAVEIVHEMVGGSGELSAEKIAKGDRNLTNLIGALNSNLAAITAQFEMTGVSAMNTFSFFGENAGDSVESLTQATRSVIGELTYARTMLRSHSRKFTQV
ncbi:insecticidal toxin complex protein TccC [Pseudomonas helmanticensis]|uniref:Insecticidal toxin complex protein TccC n=1 Tax=Pseudomonas helmanticensis TaxID=1471381 RepID=A0ACD2UEK2_9PSED|nr:RHS repeat-associated core domain-containing protein [Pseudomonas helmanticensis]SMQ30875.1 insecticidal toxin complex protein TccC [Pseudomonas helmanticensis]